MLSLYLCVKRIVSSLKSSPLHRLAALKQEWFVFLEKQTLPKGNGAAWNWMNH